MENLRIHTLLNLRKAVFGNVMDLHLGYFSGQRKGDVISKIASDVQVVQFSVTGTLQVVFKEPLQLIAYLIMLFVISAKLTLFSMLVIPVSAFFISRIVKTLKAQAQEGQQSYANMITYLDEALSGVRIIKAFNATDFVKNRFNNENHRYANIMRRMVRRQQMGSPVSELLGIMRPAKAITDSFSNIHNGVAAGERVLELIDERSEVVDKADAVAVDNFNSDIRFEHVDFAYGEHKVLSDINLTIEKEKQLRWWGRLVVVKSTLVDLIPRFMDVTRGRVLFDGKDLRDLNQESLRRLIGVVNQDSILFNDTIFNNIAFANESATQEQVEAAAKIANAHQFILNTEGGYQTNIGDRGAKLSGGQRQRLCIGESCPEKSADLMLLDEATSALDTEVRKTGAGGVVINLWKTGLLWSLHTG
ncbi:hypothetical protein FQR65_LT17577 [Abscondita terminalis]|nr:hypothetical protein FQR65_LT17577 [Abscondita terminalis]